MTMYDSIAGGFGHDAAPWERSSADFMGMCQVMIDFHLKWWQTDTSCQCSCLAFQFHVCIPSSKRAILLPSLLPSCFRAWVSWVLGEHVCTARAHPLHIGCVGQVTQVSQGTETTFSLLLGRREEELVCLGMLSKLMAEMGNKPHVLEYQPQASKYLRKFR